MLPLAHREDHDECSGEDQDDRGDRKPRESKTTVVVRLGEQIAGRGAQRSGEDVRRPEREHAVQDAHVKEHIDDGNADGEHGKRHCIAESELLGQQIAADVPSEKVKRIADQ